MHKMGMALNFIYKNKQLWPIGDSLLTPDLFIECLPYWSVRSMDYISILFIIVSSFQWLALGPAHNELYSNSSVMEDKCVCIKKKSRNMLPFLLSPCFSQTGRSQRGCRSLKKKRVLFASSLGSSIWCIQSFTSRWFFRLEIFWACPYLK